MKNIFISSLLIATCFNITPVYSSPFKLINNSDRQSDNVLSLPFQLSQIDSNSSSYQHFKTLEHRECSRGFSREQNTNLIAINSEKNLIISQCGKYIELSRLSDGKLLRTLSGHVGEILSIHANANNIVTHSSDKTIRIWRLPDGKLLHTIFPSSNGAKLVTISNNNNPIVTSIYGNILKIWK